MNGNSIRTFLGANSSEGFVSLYPQFTEHCRTLVIKGGPGSGKSSILKKIATEAVKEGHFIEYCYCSSDADSLDGIRIPEKGFCAVDGTAPHLTEPKYPGAQDEILYTGQFWDGSKLRKSLDEIQDLDRKIKTCFARAYRFLSAAGRAADDVRATALSVLNQKKMQGFAEDLLRRNIEKKQGTGHVFPRFLSGITPQGIITNRDTVYTLASKIYILEDSYGIGDSFFDTIISNALQMGHTAYVFYNPLCPSKVEHVLLPDGNVGFVTSNKIHEFEAQHAYKIHIKRFLNNEYKIKERCRNGGRLMESCLKEALCELKTEKAYHDDLEEFYIEAMDFKKLNLFAQETVKNIFSDKN